MGMHNFKIIVQGLSFEDNRNLIQQYKFAHIMLLSVKSNLP